MKTFKIYLLSDFQVYNMVLWTVVPMLYMTSPGRITPQIVTQSRQPTLTHSEITDKPSTGIKLIDLSAIFHSVCSEEASDLHSYVQGSTNIATATK